MKHAETLPDLEWVQVDHGEGAVTLVSKNDPLSLEIHAKFHKEDRLTEITISTKGGEGGHTSYTGEPGSQSFNAVVDDLKTLASRRLFHEIAYPSKALPEELAF